MRKSNHQSPANRAVLARDLAGLEAAISQGIDLEERDRGGRTALHNAAINEDAQSVAMLLRAGANVNARDNREWTPLHFAAAQDDPSVGRLLLTARADVNPQDSYGNTPLWRAVYAYSGRGDVIELLLDSGAEPNLANKSGVSPLSLARTIANFDVAKWFDR